MNAETEHAYAGIYTFIITIIALAGGQLPEARLQRFLKRTNADERTPVDRTDKLLARMMKDGYLIRIKEGMDGEDQVEYRIGPRGKVEVGEDGIEGLVRRVYGDNYTDDLSSRLERSLKMLDWQAQPAPDPDGDAPSRRLPGRPRRSDAEDQL